MLNKYPLLSIYNENGYLLIAMCFFIVKLELNESKQTVEKIKYFINQQILIIKLYLGTPFQAAYVKLDLDGQ